MNADQAGVYSALYALDDEDIVTDLDSAPWAAPQESGAIEKRESFIAALGVEQPLDAPVLREQGALVAVIARLEKTCEAFDSVDVSAEAAEISLRRRVGSLALLSSALGNVCAFALSAEHRELFDHPKGSEPVGLLAPYLSDVHMWTGDVAETLEHLARELNELAPSWSAFRECLTNVDWIYERAMAEQTRLGGVENVLPEDLRAALGELFIAFGRFKHVLAEPFG
jgi:hypothetical protein